MRIPGEGSLNKFPLSIDLRVTNHPMLTCSILDRSCSLLWTFFWSEEVTSWELISWVTVRTIRINSYCFVPIDYHFGSYVWILPQAMIKIRLKVRKRDSWSYFGYSKLFLSFPAEFLEIYFTGTTNPYSCFGSQDVFFLSAHSTFLQNYFVDGNWKKNAWSIMVFQLIWSNAVAADSLTKNLRYPSIASGNFREITQLLSCWGNYCKNCKWLNWFWASIKVLKWYIHP